MHSAKANSWCPWTLPFVDPTPQALERHVATTHEGTFLVEGKSTYTFALPDGHQVKGRDLRFSGPVETSTPRYAVEAITIGDTVIPQGDMVLVVIAAANRDATRFPTPDRLDITRADTPHLAFGHGLHYCLGAVLALLEDEIALGTLVRRLPTCGWALP
jgi:Cytochrome P450